MILIPPQTNYFKFLGIHIRWYSLSIFAAIAVSLLTALFVCRKCNTGADKNVILDFSPRLIIVSIIGARLYYVLLSLDYYLQNLYAIPMIWRGGIAIHGAFLAGVLYGIWYFKKKKLNFFPYADIFCLVLPLGQSIGRWGNFFNSEAFGVPVFSDASFALYVKEALRPLQYADFSYFCPVFLYESFFDFLIFIFLLLLTAKWKKRPSGLIFFSYILSYSILRAILEFFRLDSVLFILGIPFPAIISFVGISAGIVGVFYCLKGIKC